jgi:hypothetical protein
MQLDLFRTAKGNDIVVKETSEPGILYYIRISKRLFLAPSLTVYRGPSPSSPQLATVKKFGIFKTGYLITILQGSQRGTIALKSRQILSSKRRFMFQGNEFVWTLDKELIEPRSRKVVAHFRTDMSTSGLNIGPEGLQMVDVIVATAITMRCIWGDMEMNGLMLLAMIY